VSIRFDASADSLSRTAGLPLITSFTMMGWFYISVDQNAASSFLYFGDATNTGFAYQLQTDATGTKLNFWNGSATLVGSELPVGQWFHLALVVFGSGSGQATVYLNGAVDMSGSGNATQTAGRFTICNSPAAERAHARAAAVKMFSGPMSVQTIIRESACYLPDFASGVNAFYPLIDTGDHLNDRGPLGNALTSAGTLTAEEGPPIPWFPYLPKVYKTPGAFFNELVAEALGLTDGPQRTVVFARSVADPLGLTDAAGRTVPFLRGVADPLGLTDAPAKQAAFQRLAADALGLTDAVLDTRGIRQAVADLMGLGDAALRQAAYGRPVADPLGATDAAGRSVAFGRPVADGLGVGDAANRSTAFGRAVAETLGTQDVAGRQATYGRAAADLLGVADAVARLVQYLRANPDALGLTDSATDTHGGAGPQAYVQQVLDSLGIVDAPAKSATFSRANSETMGLADAVTRGMLYLRGLTESLTLNDATARVVHYLRSSAESLGLSDAVLEDVPAVGSVSAALFMLLSARANYQPRRV
jgi:hypothetical protein